MEDVSKLKEVPREINHGAIEEVENLLARLHSGESVAIAVVDVRRGGRVATFFSGSDSYHFLNSGAARLAVWLARVDD